MDHTGPEGKDAAGNDNSILPWKKPESRGEHPLLHVSVGVGRTFMVIRLRLYLLALHLPDESG